VSSKAAVRQQLANYRCSHTLEHGQRLHLHPLEPQWFNHCSELLTDAFVDAKGGACPAAGHGPAALCL
jgi:hypothetical protein